MSISAADGREYCFICNSLFIYIYIKKLQLSSKGWVPKGKFPNNRMGKMMEERVASKHYRLILVELRKNVIESKSLGDNH